MTPKEKSEYLVNTYRMILMNEDTDCGEEILCSLIAKKCALVAVEEILKEIEDNCMEYDDNYWQEVKTEIENL